MAKQRQQSKEKKQNNSPILHHGYLRNKAQSESVITRIVEQSNYRIRKDVADWRKALIMAENVENPRRWLVYNLYDDLVLDAHLASQIQTRKLKILGLDFKIADNKSKKPLDDKTELLERQWFYQFIGYVLDSLFYGHSLIQFSEFNDTEVSKIDIVPRRHVRPEYGDFLIQQNDTKGIPYRNTPLMDWLIEVGEDKDLGMLAKAAPNVLWKKNAMMCWSEYTEIFGMPLRVGKTNTRSNEDLDRIEQQLQQMGSAAYAVLQTGETVEFIESTKGDAFNVYDKLVDRCNSEISKLVLGQTLTADVGKSGTRAQGEVHERIADVIHKSDILFIEHVVNDKLIPLLIKHGYQLENSYFEFVIKQEITQLDWTIDSGLMQEFDIDPQYFIDKYSVPILSKKNPTEPKQEKKENTEEETENLGSSDYQKLLNMHTTINKLYLNDTCCEHEK